MHDLPADWGALCALVFLLGMRHGLDADHLAAIDGLTRLAARRRQWHARACGALFSLGHGVVVLAIAGLAGVLGAGWAPPGWFEALGGGLSIGFLLLIGTVNLRAALRAPAGAPVPLVGVRGRWVGRLLGGGGRASGPLAVAGVGALFALSFDTLGQSALFAVMATRFGGVGHALALGLLFVLGMLLSDGANGWWVSRLIARSDRRAALASRTMTLAVACASLAVAALALGRMASGWVDGLLAGRELAIGLGVAAFVGFGYLVACRAAPPPPASGARS
ncbi:MAG: nickel transporter [Rubrivivax sp.]